VRLYNLILLFYETNEKELRDEVFVNIIGCLEPIIASQKHFINISDREDFHQECLMRAYDILTSKKIKCNYFKIEGKEIIFFSKRDEYFLKEFILLSQENIDLYSNSNTEDGFRSFINSFSKYINNRKIISFFKTSFHYLRIDLYRKRPKTILISSNNPIIEDVEEDEFKHKDAEGYLDLFKGLTSFEREFLKLFIHNGSFLTQKEVSKRIGKTQQYVSKVFNKIRDKLKQPLP